MRWSVTVITLWHGLLHRFRSAKAFGLAELSQWSQPIGRSRVASGRLAHRASTVYARRRNHPRRCHVQGCIEQRTQKIPCYIVRRFARRLVTGCGTHHAGQRAQSPLGFCGVDDERPRKPRPGWRLESSRDDDKDATRVGQNKVPCPKIGIKGVVWTLDPQCIPPRRNSEA